MVQLSCGPFYTLLHENICNFIIKSTSSQCFVLKCTARLLKSNLAAVKQKPYSHSTLNLQRFLSKALVMTLLLP